ncbi:hypothetical protein [Flavobacterium sp. W21_SRS_FM6]|uniref:hypothetical protein n=1 Tax=Flavobacterium sp. W21_SRS_FM6 TaxID=3240268 RepID=UPI003F90CD32
MKTTGLLFALLLMAGCVAKQAIQSPQSVPAKQQNTIMRESLLGQWCGEKIHENGMYQKWVVNRASNGTYKIDFTTVEVSGVKEQWSEMGMWGFRYPIYFTSVQAFADKGSVYPADTSDPSLYDAYEIQELNNEFFSYKSYASGKVFTVKRTCETNLE